MTNLEKNPKEKLSKEQKRAQALRENLKKRKAQATLRKEIVPPSADNADAATNPSPKK